MAHLSMTRGDDRTVVFAFADGTEFQDGDVVRFTVKYRYSDEDDEAVLALSSDDGGITLNGPTATGVVPSTATESLTRETRLFYDWQLTTTSGEIQTLDTGTVLVRLDVTRTT